MCAVSRPRAVLSVQHSGTRFLLHRLNCGYEHTYRGNSSAVDRLLKTHDCIVPVRHPARVFESWVRRERNLRELVQQYECLMVGTKGYNLTFIDVERSGDPVAAQTGVGKMDVDPAMQARVPDWIMDWYRYARAHSVTLDELEA